jgi:hypothetical protein
VVNEHLPEVLSLDVEELETKRNWGINYLVIAKWKEIEELSVD